jgi:glycosyltransferase involved in cell wall biosynthesis
MPHQLTTINTLIENHQAEVMSVTFKKSIPSVILPQHIFFQFECDQRYELLNAILQFNPKALVVAGWFVKDFVWISKQIRKKLEIPVITYSDTQWNGTFSQRINCLLSPFHLKRAFTHIWVSGIYQYEYARKLNYSKSQILMHSLSCSKEYFAKGDSTIQKNSGNKKLIFVGRFVDVKGLDLLLEAWSKIPNKNGWILTLIGKGPLKSKIENYPEIEIKDFMNNEDLICEMRNSDCFILPSIFEPWGVVIHEAVASGLPVIASKICGAVPHFVINNYNGWVVDPTFDSIFITLQKLVTLNSLDLEKFSKHSKILSTRITPDSSVASLLSLFKTNTQWR